MRRSSLHQRVLLEYEALAPSYDRAWDRYTAATLAATLPRMPQLPPGAVLLELACGTGALAQALAQQAQQAQQVQQAQPEAQAQQATLPDAPAANSSRHSGCTPSTTQQQGPESQAAHGSSRSSGGARLYLGCDLSPAMVHQANHKLDAARLSQAGCVPAWAVCAADERLPLADATADAVVILNAFHFFAQPDRVAAEAARVLRPGGHLVVADWCADYWTCWLCELWLKLKGAALFRMHTLAQLQALLGACGLRCVSSHQTLLLRFWGFMVVVAQK